MEAVMTDTNKTLEVAFALEGERKPQIIEVPGDASVGDLLDLVTARSGGKDLEEVAIEDAEKPRSARCGSAPSRCSTSASAGR
jgi:hypothetical protein